MIKRPLIVCLLLFSLMAGCKESYVEPDTEAYGYDYYPLAIGDYRIYNVVDIRFQFNQGDTTRFQMRERVDTTFLDQTNTLNYKIIRSVRPNENSAWADDSVLVVTKTPGMVLLTMNNTKFVKLVFPVKEGAEWMGDAYNDRIVTDRQTKVLHNKELYTYQDVGESFETSEMSFPNTVKVIQNDPTVNTTKLDERREVYAKGVGMVYRIYNRIELCSSTLGCNFTPGYKVSGQERHETLVEYGSR